MGMPHLNMNTIEKGTTKIVDSVEGFFNKEKAKAIPKEKVPDANENPTGAMSKLGKGAKKAGKIAGVAGLGGLGYLGGKGNIGNGLLKAGTFAGLIALLNNKELMNKIVEATKNIEKTTENMAQGADPKNPNAWSDHQTHPEAGAIDPEQAHGRKREIDTLDMTSSHSGNKNYLEKANDNVAAAKEMNQQATTNTKQTDNQQKTELSI